MAVSLVDALSPSPIAYNKERGAQAADLFPDFPNDARALIEGAAGSSEHLSASLTQEAEWLRGFAHQTPEQIFKNILVPSDSKSDVPKTLRLAKRRASLLFALSDLGGIWSLEKVTASLSELARFAINTGLATLLRNELDRGKLPMCSEDDLADYCGMTILGMGKLGADELNYSSDIDLISLFDESRYDPDDYAQVRKTFVRVTQNLVKLLSELTSDGYVFRTDLRLRPDPAVTPVCFAISAAEHYYESVGRTWERAAMIKARPIAGDIKAGSAFLERIQPFIWRRHLDFAAVAEAQDMLLKIRAHKRLNGEPEFAGYDIKLSHGGIREIEFFAQTHQLIFGGRDPAIRSPRTTEALTQLAAAGRISEDVAQALTANYTQHRTLEHRIQMLDDAQTHQIPKSPDKRQQLANLCGVATIDELAAAVMNRVEAVHGLTALEREHREAQSVPADALEIEDAFEARELEWFALPALRNALSREIYGRLRPEIMRRFAGLSKPDDALLHFEQFLSGLPSGVQLFSLFENQPMLLDLLVDICAVSPSLAEYLGRNKSVLDAVLDRNFFEPFAPLEQMKKRLDSSLAGVDDYEHVLNAVRRWQKEQHFRNGVHLLRGISSPQEAGQVYSRIAEVSIAALLPHVEAHLAGRYGSAPGRGAAILAMGKLGSQEMTASSDLDLIVVYDPAGQTETDGKKAISVGAYYSRFTQALISAITVPTSEGSLYEVDMRLRPSGRNGPVATSLNAFAEYQRSEAWTWEHLALTRARVISGTPEMIKDVEQAVRTALEKPRDPDATLTDVREMRDKLASAFDATTGRAWETKKGPGRLLDIELFLQCGAILSGIFGARSPKEMLPKLEEADWITKENCEVLGNTHHFLASIQQVQRLVGEGFDPINGSRLEQDLLLRVMSEKTVDDVAKKMASLVKSSQVLINRNVAGPSESR